MSSDPVDTLLESFKEALDFLSVSVGTEKAPTETTNVKAPLEELDKLVKLIKAHTTKVGIIFNPEMINKDRSASANTLKLLVELTAILGTIISVLDPAVISKIFYDEVVDLSRQLLTSLQQLTQQLIVQEKGNNDGKNDEKSHDNNTDQNKSNTKTSDGRLVGVGVVWTNCDRLTELLKKGRLGLLTLKIKRGIEFLDDGIDEFEEWAEDPLEIGIDWDDEDGFSDEDEDEHKSNSDSKTPAEEESKDEDYTEVKEFAGLWLQKIKLIKLLLLLVSKSLPLVPSGEAINKIYEGQKNIIKNVDLLILTLMLEVDVTAEVNGFAKEVVKSSASLVKVVKNVNKQNENKVKWCNAWEAKFQEGF